MVKFYKHKNPPEDTSRIWARLNDNGELSGYFKYENNKWVVITGRELKALLNKSENSGDVDFSPVIGGASNDMDTLGEVEQFLNTLAPVATTGDYADLLNTPNQRTFKEFNSSWPTNSTLEAFGQAVLSDSDAKVGNAYLGGLSCSGLPAGMMQGDVTVEIIGTNNNKVARFTLTSTDVYPYHWEGCYWQGSFRGWKSFALVGKGSSLERPTLYSRDTGFMYFDTTLGLPIWYNGNDWIDASGTVV